MKASLAVVGVLVGVLALSWIVQGNNFFLYKVFAPRTEQVRRETFEQSKAYIQGQIQELTNMQFQYEQASTDHKAALRSVILRRAADIPEDRLPLGLVQFLQGLRRAQ